MHSFPLQTKARRPHGVHVLFWWFGRREHFYLKISKLFRKHIVIAVASFKAANHTLDWAALNIPLVLAVSVYAGIYKTQTQIIKKTEKPI